MPKLKKFNFKKLNTFLKKLPLILARNAFLTFLGLFLISLILGGIVFYSYYKSVKKPVSSIPGKQSLFKSQTYQEVLKIWEKKEERLKETEYKEYPNLFNP